MRQQPADMNDDEVQPVDSTVSDIRDTSGDEDRLGRRRDVSEDNDTGCGRG